MRSFLVVLALSLCAPVLAPPAWADPAPAARTDIQQVVLEGENDCLGCSLKKAEGARAACSIYGHRHALRVTAAHAADGHALPELVGQTIHYLDNDASAPLVKGETTHGQRVEVKGRYFGAEHLMDVDSFRAIGQ